MSKNENKVVDPFAYDIKPFPISDSKVDKSEPESIYTVTGTKVGELVTKKNAAYGDSFNKCADFLKLLYPNGIDTEQYTDMLCLIRMFDKMSRIATNKGAFDESPYRDIAGYALLGIVKDDAPQYTKIDGVVVKNNMYPNRPNYKKAD